MSCDKQIPKKKYPCFCLQKGYTCVMGGCKNTVPTHFGVQTQYENVDRFSMKDDVGRIDMRCGNLCNVNNLNMCSSGTIDMNCGFIDNVYELNMCSSGTIDI